MTPLISVVIPVYNAEKYLAECLDSLLAQTFTNFEVIAVDDCSTDSSVAVIESYAQKFGGRLTLSRMEKNSGSGARQRNAGMKLSRGEYIFLVDNDDLLTPTALEELYTLAKSFDADVVYCENNYRVNADGTGIHGEVFDGGVDKPTLETENLTARVKSLTAGNYRVPQWLKLVRRKLIFDHKIFFPCTRHADDTVWTWALVFYAERFLRVPNAVYVRRLTEDSIMRRRKSPQQEIIFWLDPIVFGLEHLDELLGGLEFFRRHANLRYALLEDFLLTEFGALLEQSEKLPPFAVYETIKDAFGKNFGEHDVLIAALFTALNTYQKIFARQRQTKS